MCVRAGTMMELCRYWIDVRWTGDFAAGDTLDEAASEMGETGDASQLALGGRGNLKPSRSAVSNCLARRENVEDRAAELVVDSPVLAVLGLGEWMLTRSA